MNKKFIIIGVAIIAVIVVIIVVVAAVLPNDPDPVDPTPTTSSGNQQVVLIWWNMFESQENVQPLIDAFEQKFPNVEIQYDQKGTEGGIDSYRNLLDSALSDEDPNSSPDIFTIANTWVDAYQDKISPAPQSVMPADYLNDFYPIVTDDFGDNAIWGVPLYVDSIALIYNKDKLIQQGYTVPSNDWASFQDQAVTLTQRDDRNDIFSAGFSTGYSDNAQFSFDILNLLMLQNGTIFLNPAEDEAIFANQAESQDATAFFNSFISTDGTWDESFKVDVATFLEEGLAIYPAPSWRLEDILEYNELHNLNLDIGVAPVPQIENESPINWAAYWGQAVSVDSGTNSQYAWEFLKFATEPEQLRLLDLSVKTNGRKLGIIFPRQSMNEELSGDKYLQVYAQSMWDAKTWNMPDGYLVQKSYDQIFSIEGSRSLVEYQEQINKIIQNSQ